jgi:Trk K+ transport system NAD-binding subunit
MLSLAFFQPAGEFPNFPILQIWYFVLPLVGLITLAQGLAEFGILLFNRKTRSKEWEMAVASTFNNHTVLIGLGHLGYRVAVQLNTMEEAVVAIENNPSAELIKDVQQMGIPVIQEDATRPSALESAGIKKAKTIVLCSQNDAMNLQIAVKARSLNPKVQVVIRIFDEDFAQSLNAQYGYKALSATGMAAPIFAAAAAGADVTAPISIEGQTLSLARLTISKNSSLEDKTVGYIEDNFHVSLVLVRHNHSSEMHPTNDLIIKSGDIIAALGGPKQLYDLLHANE